MGSSFLSKASHYIRLSFTLWFPTAVRLFISEDLTAIFLSDANDWMIRDILETMATYCLTFLSLPSCRRAVNASNKVRSLFNVANSDVCL